MANPTILVILSTLIVLFLFVIGGYIFNKNKNQSIAEKESIEKQINTQQLKNMEKLFKSELNEFFQRYNKEYEEINLETNVASLNKKYTNELKEIINNDIVKTTINIEDSKYNKEANFLKVIIKETPFVWNKKFAKEIEEYYG